MFGRKKIAMLVAEFLGTGVLTLVVLAVQRSTIGIPYFVGIGAGLTVAALSLVFATVSGAHFNPAITIGMWSARKVKTLPAVMYVVSQLLGAWAAYGIYTYFVNSSLQPIGSHFTARIFVAEGVGALIFAFIWAAVAAQKLSATVIGAGFTLAIIIAASASVGIVNPAVALGARAWTLWFKGSVGWAYALGPVVGGIVGFNLYQLVYGDGLAQLKTVAARATTSSAPAPVAKTTVAKATAAKPAAKAKKAPAKKRK
jgi:glycerol uptake facilitator-like aquaporin